MSVQQIVEPDLVTATGDETVRDVARKMREHSVDTVIVTQGGSPVGIVADRDVALAVADASPDDTTVQAVMTEDVVTVPQDGSLLEAANVMQEAGVRQAPVVDDGGTLSGVVALDAILLVIERHLEAAAGVIESQLPQV